MVSVECITGQRAPIINIKGNISYNSQTIQEMENLLTSFCLRNT